QVDPGRVLFRLMEANGIRILIAEDNALLRGVLRDALEEAGMTVVGEASDGAEAVTVAEKTLPDVVVMDMRMPNVDGIEATEQIAAADWAMPVVVLSAYDEPQMIEAALAAGATSAASIICGSSYAERDRKSTRLNSSHQIISYAV